MKNERGFTLPELLVVGVAGLVLVSIMLFLLRPNDYAAEKRNAERRVHLATILQAIGQYEDEKGELPEQITAEETAIASSEQGGVGLCDDLVPAYLDDLPKDPLASIIVVEGPCNAPQQAYVTGYTVRQDGGRIILAAPGAEKNEKIEIERWFPLL